MARTKNPRMRAKAKVHAKWHRREQRLKAGKPFPTDPVSAEPKPTPLPEPTPEKIVAEAPPAAPETPQPAPEA